MQKKIIFFTKAPALGYGKSRLRGFLSDQAVYDLTARLITENSTAAYTSGIPVVVYYAGERENLAFLAAESSPVFKPQCGAGLGERMFNALKEELKTADAVILMGSDLLGITADSLQQAFTALEHADAVIAPAQDGGYGIIGMQAPHDVFSGITFSTPNVYRETCAALSAQGLTYTELAPVRDIDTPEDLAAAETGSSTVQLIGQGEYNINYRFDNRYVLRINTASQLGLGEKQIEYEYRCLQELEPTGVTPKVYRYALHGAYIPYGTLVMEYIPGRPLDYSTDMETAAFLLAQVHNHRFDAAVPFIRAEQPFKAMYEECRQMYAHYTAWQGKDPQVTGFVERFFAAVLQLGIEDRIEHPCIINTELNNRNFIIGNTRDSSRIIDWEKPLIGECEQDLAHFLAPTTTHWKTETILSAAEREMFLSYYERYRLVNRQKLNKYLRFNCLRGITWCCMARVEYEQQRTVANPETFARIKEFLSPDFLSFINHHFYEVPYV